MKPLFLIIITLCSLSCSEEEIGPCYDSEQQCKNLLRQMEQSTDPAEKEQFRQYYLAEKHFLDNCRKNN